MAKYVIKRILLAIVTAFIIISLTFILMKLLPFQRTVGTQEQVIAFYQKQVELGYVIDFSSPQEGYGELLYSSTIQSTSGFINHYYYQRPIMEQYGSWLVNIFTKWDWGVSSKVWINVSAITIIKEQLPTTIKINVVSVILSVPLGILLGVVAALKKNKMVDHVISTLVMVFISIPNFIIITFLIMFFGYNLGILPTKWPVADSPIDMQIAAYVIPVLALSFGSVCGYCRFTRAELCDVMASDYLLLARTKGLTKKQAIVRHALRNAMVPIVPSILAEFIGVLSGSMILENLYNIPGIGRLFIEALNQQDYNVVLVDMALFTMIGLVAGVILDISYGFIDPRIRMGAKK